MNLKDEETHIFQRLLKISSNIQIVLLTSEMKNFDARKSVYLCDANAAIQIPRGKENGIPNTNEVFASDLDMRIFLKNCKSREILVMRD